MADYSILGDNPVRAEDDRLDFGAFVEPFARRLILSRKNTPFTVGVFAEWGQWKTTVLQMLQASLARQGCPTVWFDPWKYESRETVWKGLALTLVAEVRRNSTLMREIRRKRGTLKSLLAEGLLSRLVGSDWAGKIVKAVETEPWSPSLLHEFESTLATLFELIDPAKSGKLERPLVLFVDDLDRCLPEPALAVLEALKLVLNKPGLIVIMGIAESELGRAVSAGYGKELKESGATFDPEWGKSYLRKIIQMPFPLPAVTERSLDEYIGDCLERSGVAAALRGDERWRAIIREACGGNLREVKRFVNHFISETDKAEANLAALAIDGVAFDPPRVAFFLLLDRRFHEFLEHVRRRADDPELLLRFQLVFLRTATPPEAEPDARDREFYENELLRALFMRCLTASEARPALVAPFARREDFEPYLQFGRRPEVARPLGSMTDRTDTPEEAVAPTEDEVATALADARTLSAAGRLDLARGELARGLALAQRRADRPAELAALLQLGLIDQERGEPEDAYRSFERTWSLARELGDRRVEGAALRGMARGAVFFGRQEEAISQLEEAIVIARSLGDPLEESAALVEKGAAYEAAREFDVARKAYVEALAITRQLENASGELSLLLRVAVLENSLSAALADCAAAERIAESLNDRQALVQVFQRRGEVETRWGQIEDSAASYQRAAQLAREIGSDRDAARIFSDRGGALARSGYPAEAVEAFEQALQLFQEAGDEREAKRVARALERVRPKQDE